MPHIHEKIDFTVGALIVHDGRVLFVHHIGMDRWLPPGGHVELDEDTDQALFREIEEETGLHADDLEILEEKLPDMGAASDRKQLWRPRWADIHRVNDQHRHIGFGYVFRAKTDAVRHQAEESRGIQWLGSGEFHNLQFKIPPEIIRYAEEAIRIAS